MEVLLKEREDKCVGVLLKEGEDKFVVVGVGVVALAGAVDVAMCAREMLRNQLTNWTRSLTTTILVR